MNAKTKVSISLTITDNDQNGAEQTRPSTLTYIGDDTVPGFQNNIVPIIDKRDYVQYRMTPLDGLRADLADARLHDFMMGL